ncbi:iron-containing redox enzyme family protein [Salinarimonas sp.]|uniref:iron-containing redox enzyme family protein n=1 Tax=Salinarimonas sp. TaxID=2766526 RepID=UPI0032D8B833
MLALSQSWRTRRKKVVFSAGAIEEGEAVIGLGAAEVLRRLLRDRESEASFYVARRVVAARLESLAPDADLVAATLPAPGRLDADALIAYAVEQGVACARTVSDALAGAETRVHAAVLRERAPLALLAGGWLDGTSQPAAQPGETANAAFGRHWHWLGEGIPERSAPAQRRRGLERRGVVLPSCAATTFVDAVQASPTTSLAASFMLALGRFSLTYLPEVVGFEVAFHAIGLDQALLDAPDAPTAEDGRFLLETIMAEAGRADADETARRVLHGAAAALSIERRHAALLAELATRTAGQSLDSRVAALVRRHAPMAGSQHRRVRVGGVAMSETFSRPDVDIEAFMRAFKASSHLRTTSGGSCRFVQALKFGGPMFGIFDAEEAELFALWSRTARETADGPIDLSEPRPEDPAGLADLAVLQAGRLAEIAIADAELEDPRETFHRLVNVELHPHVLAPARSIAAANLETARFLFEAGAQGRYTDGSFFPYSPDALLARVDAIYWDKLVTPYTPLEAVPSRDEVIAQQKAFALGNLIDGSWSWRIGAVSAFERPSDGRLFAIHADEMGLGDTRKNHITLICRVLAGMGVSLPHIADPEFRNETEFADELYGFALHQLSLALFPDTFYPEIVGYNLAIEMFGLGELRLHEIQKLKAHGFDAIYEEAHLSIDNASSGHARQSAEIVITYLDDVRRSFGEAEMHAAWERVWTGYCSFARFVEAGRIPLPDAPAGMPTAEPDGALDVLIL